MGDPMSTIDVEPVVDPKALFSLDGKVSIITGAGAGMGRQMAITFGAAGSHVVLFDRDGDAAERVAGELAGAAPEALAIHGDVTDEAAVGRAVEAATERFGAVDVLINNAGVLSQYDFLDMKMDDWDRVMDINLRGALLCMKAVLPGMVARRSGSVINIGSSWSSKGAIFNQDGGGPDYCVSKAAVQALTKSAAQDVAPAGVRVNAIAPGAVIDTPMHDHDREQLAEYAQYVPIGRLQYSNDIVGTAVYLASDASAYVTGQSIHVNGGMLMVD
jgi:3-oxoacyl-[acyl-carrier protein] reductase